MLELSFRTHPGRENPEIYDLILNDPVRQELDWNLCVEDVWYFISGWCKTIDIDGIEKPFPLKDYIKITLWEMSNEKHLFIEKPRQMIISWLAAALDLWFVLTHGNVTLFYRKVSFDKANMFLKERVWGMWNRLPDHIKSRFKVNESRRGDHKKGIFEVSSVNSRIYGIAQGIGKLQGESAAGHTDDDAQMSDNLEEDMKTARPIIGSIGYDRYIGNPRIANAYWKRMAKNPGFGTTKIARGIETWVNEIGYTVLSLSLWADPDKDPETEQGKKWCDEMKSTMDREIWEREYMKNWEAGAHGILFPQFGEQKKLHIASPFPKFNPFLPILCGWDFGKNPSPAVMMMMQVEMENRDGSEFTINVLKTIIENGLYSTDFIPMAVGIQQKLYPTKKTYDFIDVAGTRQEARGVSEWQILKEPRLDRQNVFFKKVENKDKIDLVNFVLRLKVKGEIYKVYLKIDPTDPGNQQLIAALEYGITAHGDHNLKADHPYKDVLDVLCYILAWLFTLDGRIQAKYCGQSTSDDGNDTEFWRGRREARRERYKYR